MLASHSRECRLGNSVLPMIHIGIKDFRVCGYYINDDTICIRCVKADPVLAAAAETEEAQPLFAGRIYNDVDLGENLPTCRVCHEVIDPAWC